MSDYDKATHALCTIIPAAPGTYGIFDAREEAERRARVPLYVELKAVLAWHMMPRPNGVVPYPVYLSGTDFDCGAMAMRMPDGKVVEEHGYADYGTFEEFIASHNEPTLKLVAGGRQ